MKFTARTYITHWSLINLQMACALEKIIAVDIVSCYRQPFLCFSSLKPCAKLLYNNFILFLFKKERQM